MGTPPEGDPFKKVISGRPLRISARALNRLYDLARTLDLGGTGGGPLDFARQPATCKVQNNTGADQGRFSILGLSAPIVPPGTDLAEFQRQTTFVGTAPATPGVFCVLLEPVASGAIGKGLLAGVCPVKLSGAVPVGGLADIVPGSTAALGPSPAGSAQVLYYDASTGWAVVKLGAPGSGDVVGQITDITPTHLASGKYVYGWNQLFPATGWTFTNPGGSLYGLSHGAATADGTFRAAHEVNNNDSVSSGTIVRLVAGYNDTSTGGHGQEYNFFLPKYLKDFSMTISCSGTTPVANISKTYD